MKELCVKAAFVVVVVVVVVTVAISVHKQPHVYFQSTL